MVEGRWIGGNGGRRIEGDTIAEGGSAGMAEAWRIGGGGRRRIGGMATRGDTPRTPRRLEEVGGNGGNEAWRGVAYLPRESTFY